MPFMHSGSSMSFYLAADVRTAIYRLAWLPLSSRASLGTMGIISTTAALNLNPRSGPKPVQRGLTRTAAAVESLPE